MRSRSWDLLLVAHRWVALTATLFILVLAITGSAMVFEGAIDRGLNPSLWKVADGAGDVSIDTLVAHARAAVPRGSVTGVTLSPVGDRADVVSVGATQVFVDPHTGAVKGTRSAAEFQKTLPRRLHVLHVSLMAGKGGGTIVGIATILALLLVLSGTILWWPDKRAAIQWSASWKRVVFDLHHAVGIFAGIVLLVITASGLVIHYDALGKAIEKLDTTPAPPPPKQTAPAGPAQPISLDSVKHSAMAALPGASPVFLTLSAKPTVPYVVAMRYPEDRTPGGRSRVFVDRYTGAALQVRSTRVAELGTRVSNEIRSIHTGDLWGKPTEAVWLLAALALASQAVTGLMMWWNGRRARAARTLAR